MEPLSCFDQSNGSVSAVKKTAGDGETISNYGEVDITRFNKSIGFDKSVKNVWTGAGEVLVSEENYSKSGSAEDIQAVQK